MTVHLHVAETDAQARAQAEPAYEQFMHNYSYRYVRRSLTDRYAARRHFADEVKHGGLVVGSRRQSATCSRATSTRPAPTT